jgi:hypothetical protein
LELATNGAERFFYSKWKTKKREWMWNRWKLTGNGCGELEIICKSDFESDDEDSGEF